MARYIRSGWPSMPAYGDLATVRPEPFEVRVDDDGCSTIVDARGDLVAVVHGADRVALARVVVAALSVRMDASEAVDEVERLENENDDLREDAEAADDLEGAQASLDEALDEIERARDALASGRPAEEVFEMLNHALPGGRELYGEALAEKLKMFASAGGGG